jgi:hypothetical protein
MVCLTTRLHVEELRTPVPNPQISSLPVSGRAFIKFRGRANPVVLIHAELYSGIALVQFSEDRAVA